MARTAVLTKDNQTNDSTPESDLNESNGNNGTEKKRGSPFMYALSPEMIQEPYPLDFADGMDSFDFAREKCRRSICGPLKFKSQKEWLKFASSVWEWVESASDREAKIQANQLVERIKNLIAETSDNPKLNQLIKEQLADVVDS